MIGALALFVVAAAVSWRVTEALVPILRERGVVDVPGSRSSHVQPTPRGGGLAIVPGIAVGLVAAWALGLPLPGAVTLAAAALVCAVGAVDDVRSLPAGIRLLVHVAAAGCVVAALGPVARLPLPAPLDVELGILGAPLTVLWIVGVTNIFNFLDGIDGYAAAQAVVASVVLAVLGGGGALTMAGATLAGASAGFLFHNWHPAKVFMGDVGSGMIGFLLGALPLETDIGDRPEVLFASAMALWFFLADGTFTIVRRLANGERIWVAHRSHLYQRLVIAGLSHDAVVARIGAGMVAVAAAVVPTTLSGGAASRWGVLAFALVLFGAFVVLTRRAEREGAR